MVFRLVTSPFARANDLDTYGAGPINHFINYRRLVTVSHGVNQSLFPGLFIEHRAQ